MPIVLQKCDPLNVLTSSKQFIAVQDVYAETTVLVVQVLFAHLTHGIVPGDFCLSSLSQ